MGPGFCALTRSKLIRCRFLGTPQRHRLGWACILCLSRSEQLNWPGAWWAQCPRWSVSLNHLQATRFPGYAARLPSQVCHVSPLGSWSLAATLLAYVNRPGSQEDLVSNWEPTHNLVKDAIPGAKVAPCLMALAVAHMPLCLRLGSGLVCSQLPLLWYLLNPLFCEQARLCLRLCFSWESSLSLSFPPPPPLAIPQFGLLSHVSSLRLSSGHSGRILTLSMQLALPCSAHARWWRTWASGLLLWWELRLGTYSVGFFPPSYVALWESKTPHRSTSERVSWCFETSPPSWLPPWDESPSLTLLSLFLSILSYLLLKRMGCLSWCLMSSTSVQKLFCGNCSAFKWPFDEFVGEKVVSLSYSSAILGPPSLKFHFLKSVVWYSNFDYIIKTFKPNPKWKEWYDITNILSPIFNQQTDTVFKELCCLYLVGFISENTLNTVITYR